MLCMNFPLDRLLDAAAARWLSIDRKRLTDYGLRRCRFLLRKIIASLRLTVIQLTAPNHCCIEYSVVSTIERRVSIYPLLSRFERGSCKWVGVPRTESRRQTTKKLPDSDCSVLCLPNSATAELIGRSSFFTFFRLLKSRPA